MARYLDGEHHPQKALPPRVAFAAMDADSIVGHIGGHETTRYGREGELQYLYVVPGHRRTGVASELLRLLAGWFRGQGVSRVCVAVDEDNAGGLSFLAHHGAQKLDSSFLTWSEISEVLSD
jgi:GNAT superfamily N-acetyltransferase